MGLSVYRVPAGFGQRLVDWGELCSRLGERWFFELDGLATELYGRLRLRPPEGGMRVPSPQLGYDGAAVYGCFAVWLPALVGDVLATLRLGAGYGVGLRKRLAGQPATTARARGGYLAPQPPPLLRMTVVARTLLARGLHSDARAQYAAFAAQAGDVGVVHLPMQDGQWLELEGAFVVGLAQQVTDALLGHGFECLDGFRLEEIPGFAHTAHERAVQTGLAERLGRPASSKEQPVRLLGAVLRSADRPGASDEKLLLALRYGLTNDEQRSSVQSSRPAAGSLSEALRDRQTLVEAVVLSEALSRRSR